jgi:hypothetical protein
MSQAHLEKSNETHSLLTTIMYFEGKGVHFSYTTHYDIGITPDFTSIAGSGKSGIAYGIV